MDDNLVASNAIDTNNHKQWIEAVYTSHRESFVNWAKLHYSLDPSIILDIYQDATIILYNHFKNNKLLNVKSSIKAYLFGIGKNLIHNRMRKNKRTELTDEFDDKQIDEVNFDIFYSINGDDQREKLDTAFKQLGTNCKELLTLFYYHQYSTDAIRSSMNYKSTSAVKSRKYQCLEKLRKIFMASA